MSSKGVKKSTRRSKPRKPRKRACSSSSSDTWSRSRSRERGDVIVSGGAGHKDSAFAMDSHSVVCLPGDGIDLSPLEVLMVAHAKEQGAVVHFCKAVAPKQAELVRESTFEEYKGDSAETVIRRADGTYVVSLCDRPFGYGVAGSFGRAVKFNYTNGEPGFYVKRFERGKVCGLWHAAVSPDGAPVDVRVIYCGGSKGPRVYVNRIGK